MIVVDLGCYDPAEEFSSLTELIRRFRPSVIYGFDMQETDRETVIECVPVIVKRAAATTHDGVARFLPMNTQTRLAEHGHEVDAIDFSRWLRKHGPAVVKMDIEGHEYPLLEKMHADGTDALVDLLVIEWHGEPMTGLRCPVELWWN